MVLPIDSTSLNPATATHAQHVAWHNEIASLLPALGLPTVTTSSAGHRTHHQTVHEYLEMGLPFSIAENAQNHLPDHHRLLHLYLTRGPQDITQPGGSQSVSPGSDPATAITAAGNNGTVWFASGTHRIAGYANLRPRTGQTWVGHQNAIISGAVIISGSWTTSGSQSWATAQLPATANATGVCEGGGTDCQPCEDVYLNGVKLRRVMSQAAVVSGTFWGDYPNNRIYLFTADNPSGGVVEQAKKANFIHSDDAVNANVTIKNLTIQQFANPYQQAAICCGNNPAGTGWLVEQCLIKYNHADGIKTFGNNTTVRRCIINQNGAVGGPSGFEAATLVAESNEVSANNNNNFDTGWEAGGAKPVHLDDPIYRGNVFKDNIGTGLWFDIDTRRALVRWNSAVRNETGIYYEISFDGTIDDNYAADNTTEQIWWNASARGYVRRNRIIVPGGSAGYGVRFAADPARDTSDPSDYEPHTLAGVDCTDNDITHKSTALYASSIYMFNTSDTNYLNAVTFNNNTYRLAYRTDDAFLRNATAENWTAWQAAGKDANSTRLGAVATNTGLGATGGTTVSLANSAGSSGVGLNPTIGSGATLVWDANRVPLWGKSIQMSTSATAASTRATWTSTEIGTLTGTLWFRWYLWFDANPSAGFRLINWLTAAGATLNSGLAISSGGLIQMVDSAGTGTIITTTPISLGQFVRVECQIVQSTTVGQQILRLYNSPYSTTVTQEVSSAANLALQTNVDTCRMGSPGSVANIAAFNFARPAISQEGWIGV